MLLPEHTCYDRYSISSIHSERHALCKNISGVFPHLERRIYTYVLCVTAKAHLLRSIFPFKQVLRTAHDAFYRKHSWCFSTFRTKNIHIYLVCCCQRTIAMIDISFRARITSHTRFICCWQRTLATSIFLFEPVLRAARAFYRKHF